MTYQRNYCEGQGCKKVKFYSFVLTRNTRYDDNDSIIGHRYSGTYQLSMYKIYRFIL